MHLQEELIAMKLKINHLRIFKVAWTVARFCCYQRRFCSFRLQILSGRSETRNHPVGTRDIDLLISRRVPEVFEKNIAKHLHEAGFTHVFKDVDVPATEAYVKEIDG